MTKWAKPFTSIPLTALRTPSRNQVNLVATPRKAKEAIGAICKLTHEDGRVMVANVEYNQLEPLLLASGFSEGIIARA